MDDEGSLSCHCKYFQMLVRVHAGPPRVAIVPATSNEGLFPACEYFKRTLIMESTDSQGLFHFTFVVKALDLLLKPWISFGPS